MRLWHIDLIPYLPKSQLLAQWRELNSIFKKQDKHILINYVYDYPKTYLGFYTKKVIDEMLARNIKIKSYKNFEKYFSEYSNEYGAVQKILSLIKQPKFAEHNDEYLTICYWNLREKYLRGQKDFLPELWNKLEKFYKEKTK